MRLEERLIVELTGEVERENPPLVSGVDWSVVRRLARANRMTGLVFDGLDRSDLFSSLPEEVGRGFEAEYLHQVTGIRSALALAGDLAARFAAAGVPLVILRGLALGLTVYPRPFLRPFSDLDLLVFKSDLNRAKAVLGEAGLEKIPGTLPDRYFQRHHLHLAYLHPPTGFPVELHWAFDHPYTLSRIAYPDLFDRRREVTFAGATIPILGEEDRLITLALHLVKHIPFLPELLEEKDFPSWLLKGRWLLWILDIRQVIRASGAGMDWDALFERSVHWNLAEETAAGLRAAAAIYPEVSLPELNAIFSRGRSGFLRSELYRRQLIYLEKRRLSDRLTRFLFGLRSESIFRPVRLLDLGRYLFPGNAWLRQNCRGRRFTLFSAALFHTLAAAGRLSVNLLDYLYYSFRSWYSHRILKC